MILKKFISVTAFSIVVAGLSAALVTSFRTENLIVENSAQFGSASAAAVNSKVRITGIDPTQSSQVWIDDLSSNHTGSAPGPNESNGITIEKDTGFDTTASSGVTKGIEMGIDCHVDTGSNGCTAVGLQVSAADTAWLGISGAMVHEDIVDFTLSSNVRLGNQVDTFVVPGSALKVPQIDLGQHEPVNGFNVRMKNTAATSLAGVQVALDTTAAGNARGGFVISRGANGDMAGNTSGIAMAGDGTYPFVGSVAGQLSIYSETGQDIPFGADNVGFTKFFGITPKNHLAVYDDSGNNTPALNAGCTSGTGSTIVGADTALKVKTGTTSTACTITFKRTFTSAPICQQTPEGTATLATCTYSATAITCTTNQSATTYNFSCWGQPGST